MCHTPSTRSAAARESEAFQGGLIPMQNWYAPSLTSNREAGLGDWSIKDITDLLQTGVSDARRGLRADGGSRLQQPAISDRRGHPGDGGLPQGHAAGHAAGGRELDRPHAPKAACCQPGQDRLRQSMRELPWRDGARQTAALSAARRQPVDPDGIGGQPDPDGAERRLSAGHRGNPMPYGMPPFAQSLSDDEVAAVVTYIRTAWGNRGAPVSAREANELRSAPLN